MNKKGKKVSLLMGKRAVGAQIALLCVINLSLKKSKMRCHLTSNANPNPMLKMALRSGLTAPKVLLQARKLKVI